MATERDWDSIPNAQILPGAPVQAEQGEGRKLLAQLNALDEAAANRAAPGASSQQYFGHDHAFEGGAPIIRGLCWAADGGHTAIKVFDPIAVGTVASGLGWMNASPGLNANANQSYLVAIRYRATGCDWHLQFNSGPEQVLSIMKEADVPVWVQFTGRIPQVDWLGLGGLVVEPLVEQERIEECQLDIFAILVWETYQQSQPRTGLIDMQPQPSGETVYSYPNAVLDSELEANDAPVDVYTITSAMMRANAVYEFITDRAAPGAANQQIIGHDHYSAGNGGRSVPMGCVYSARTYRTTAPLWAVHTNSQNVWYYWDADASAGARRTTAASTPAGTATTDPMLLTYVTYNFSSSGNPPTSAPYIVGYVYFRHAAKPTQTIEVRLYHLNTGNHSAIATGSGVSDETLFVSGIPCTAGVINRYAIEVRCTSTNNVDVDMMGLSLFEIGESDSTNRTYEASNGDTPLAVPNDLERR